MKNETTSIVPLQVALASFTSKSQRGLCLLVASSQKADNDNSATKILKRLVYLVISLRACFTSSERLPTGPLLAS